MSAPQLVTVFNFRRLEQGFESAPVSSYKATRHYIEAVIRGDPLEITAEAVPADDLDVQGCYRRLTTRWGEVS